MKKNSEIHLFSEGKREFYNPSYKWCLDSVDASEARHWRWNQTHIENDYDDLVTKLNPQELHGVKEVLRLFTLYETEIGENYWQGIVGKVFPHPEIKMMCARFAYEEFGIHARAYAEINNVLGELDEEHMTSWRQDENLVKRMKFLEDASMIPKDYNALNILKSLAAFVFIEGMVLSASFAFIKHFKSNGKNLLPGIVEAINYSLNDEAGHYEAGSRLFRELREQASLTDEESDWLDSEVLKLFRKTTEHEGIIIENIFSKGRIIGITKAQLIAFVSNQGVRLMEMMGIEQEEAKIEKTEIETWYWTNTAGLKVNDFFAVQSTAYSHHWTKSKF